MSNEGKTTFRYKNMSKLLTERSGKIFSSTGYTQGKTSVLYGLFIFKPFSSYVLRQEDETLYPHLDVLEVRGGEGREEDLQSGLLLTVVQPGVQQALHHLPSGHRRPQLVRLRLVIIILVRENNITRLEILY